MSAEKSKPFDRSADFPVGFAPTHYEKVQVVSIIHDKPVGKPMRGVVPFPAACETCGLEDHASTEA